MNFVPVESGGHDAERNVAHSALVGLCREAEILDWGFIKSPPLVKSKLSVPNEAFISFNGVCVGLSCTILELLCSQNGAFFFKIGRIKQPFEHIIRFISNYPFSIKLS